MTANKNFLKLFSILAILGMMLSNIQPPRVQALGGDSLKPQVNQVNRVRSAARNADVVPTATVPPTELPLPTETPVAEIKSTPIGDISSLTPETPNLQSAKDQAVDASGVTWYVAIPGNDTNSCLSTSLPCATVNGAIGKAANGATIKIATGTYIGSGTEVALINKSVALSGGWDTSFTSQAGKSNIDGQGVRRGVTVNGNATASMEHIVVRNGKIDQEGAGIYVDSGNTLTLNNVLIRDNTTVYRGAGIYINSGATVTLNNSALSNNTGNGIYNYGTLTMNSSSVSGSTNGAITNSKDGASNLSATLLLNNSTVSGNFGTMSGIYNQYSLVALKNSTISGNYAYGQQGGGGIYNEGYPGYTGTITIMNTIIAGNSATYKAPDCSGEITSAGYNLIGNTSGCTFTSSIGDLTNVNAKLKALVGFPGYQPLEADSPAVNAGNPALPGSGSGACLAADERGVVRPVGVRCDIGAYEYTVPGPVATLRIVRGDDQHAGPGLDFSIPLEVEALDRQGTPLSDITVTFTAPSTGASILFTRTGTPITTAVTNYSGIASSYSFKANTKLGSYTVTASANGATPANFNLENLLWFVAPTGNDSSSCTAATSPCKSLNTVIAKAAANDTILVAEGLYPSGNGYSISKPLTLSGGWNSTFSSQSGITTLDGQGTFVSILSISSNVTIERLGLQNSGYTGLMVYTTGLRSVLLKQSAVYGNSGSGIETHGADLLIENSTISGNSKEGIRNSSGTLRILNSTITGNSKSGIYNYSSDSALIQNSILFNNTEDGRTQDCVGHFTSLGNNIYGASAGCDIQTLPSDLINVNPQMSPLVGTGYHPLSASSPAIGAANPSACPATDQRGVSRLQDGACDIGAYEYSVPGTATNITILSGNNQSAAPNFAFVKPLQVLSLDSKGSPVPNLNINFTAPASGASGVFAASSTNVSSVPTDKYGVATTSIFTANSRFGNYSVTATAAGLPAVNFSLANFSWFVAPGGNDSNNCTSKSTPCATINGALAKAASGDMIEVAEGTYTGAGTEVILLNKPIILIGGWDATFSSQTGYSIIDGQTLRRGITISSGETQLSRFRVQNCINNGILNSGSAIIDKSIISGNSSTSGGAGIYNTGTMVLKNSSVMENQFSGDLAYRGGGGIDNEGNLTINNTTISGNHASGNSMYSGYGGGIYNIGNLTIGNTTISRNTAFEGAGLYNANDGTENAKLNNITIAENTASSVGGGIFEEKGSLIVSNSIIARNTASSGAADCYAWGVPIVSNDYNIFGNTNTCDIKVDQAGHDKLNINAQLSLFNPVLGFVPLGGSSPAIDAGNPATPGSGGNACLSVDQRGVTRPVDGPDADTIARCDIGAIEYVAAGAATDILYGMGSPQIVAPNSKLPTPLQVVVVDSLGTPKPNISVTFSAPLNGPSGVFTGNGTNTATVVTDSGGIATTPDFIANGLLGSYKIVASAAGLSKTVDFSITNGNWFVSTDGNDLNDCTSALTACATIQGVLGKSTLSGGNTIRVKLGVYNTANSVYIKKNISISGGWDSSFTNQIGTSVIEDPIVIDPGATSTIENVTVRNIIDSIGIWNSGTLTLKDSSIVNNNLGIHDLGTLTIVNSTISGNGRIGSPPGYGGGLDVENPAARVFILNSTISNNYAHSGGGIFNASSAAGIVTLQNSIIAGNSSDPGRGIDCEGGDMSGRLGVRGLFVSLGGNLIGDIGQYNDVEYPCRSNWMPTDIIGDHVHPVDAKLDVLSNVGNDVWVHRLKFDSPAIDAGLSNNCPTIDQLGTARPQGFSCDIGSYEYPFFAISGNGGVPGVVLSYTYGTAKSVTSASDGSYSILVPNTWSGTITPSLQCYSFTPASRSYSNVTTNQINQNYTATSPAPCVLSITRTGSNPTSPGNVNFTVTFTKPVTGVDVSDFALTTGGITGASISNVTGSSTTYTVTVNTGSGSGSVRLDLVDDDSIKDSSNVPLGGVGTGNGNYTSGEHYNMVIGADTVGVFRPSNGVIFLKNTNTSGFADIALNYGLGGDYPIVGDWDGNGTDTIGVYRGNTFLLRNSNTVGFANLNFVFGQVGDQPVAGDWDGDGKDTIGVYRPSTGQFLLRNSNSAGLPEISFYLGNVGDVGIAGDWDGDGIDTTGVFRPSNGVIFLKNTNATGYADVALNYGLAGDKPVVGDWDNNGTTTIGIYRGAKFYLRNSNTNGFANITLDLGIPGDMPIAGNWDGKP